MIIENVPGNQSTNEDKSRVTMEKNKQIAETIDSNLKVTTDTTTNYEDRRLPILDVKVWIGNDRNGDTRILHMHYLKDVTTRSVINERSAHGKREKKNIIINEICRVLKNCSIHIPWEETAKQVTYFSQRLQYSGYSKHDIHEMISKALNKHDRRTYQYQTTGTMYPMSTDKDKVERKRKKKEWYTDKGRYGSVMFVEATPDGLLKKEIQKAVKKNKMKIKVVEMAGVTVKRLLQKSNPFEINKCKRNDCKICTLNNKVDCKSRGCVYEIKCMSDD